MERLARLSGQEEVAAVVTITPIHEPWTMLR